MPAERTCSQCGAPLPVNAPGGRCPQCLVQLALEESGGGQDDTHAEAALEPGVDLRGKTNVLAGTDMVTERTGMMIGRYKLLQQIGEGGFGTVFMAEQVEPVQRKVALKIIKAGMDTREIIARFEAERQALALMDHPNIAQVLDGGATTSGRPYFVMELVRGMPITSYCHQANLTTRQRLELFNHVCCAVQHAHQKGVIHRDLKPSNVMVTLHDGEAVPKVIDFGVAKALGQKLTDKTLFTRFEQMIGTPAYMSPEQAALSGLDIDTRSDIYSLGVLLYELLTGVTPLDAETLRRAALDELRRMIQETEPPKPSTRMTDLVAADVRRLTTLATERDRASLRRLLQQKKELISVIRGDLDWITMKALEKDRRRRYETVNGLAADIERHLKDEPVVARPPSPLYRMQKVARRHRVAFAAGAAVAVALVQGVVISTWQAVRATHAERQARNSQASETNQRQRAEQKANEAKQNAAESRARLVRQYVANGNRLGDEGDLLGALPWFAKALKEEQDPSREDTHRLRLGTTLQQCPELVQVWFHKDVVRDTKFSPEGHRIVTASEDHTARLWELRGVGAFLTMKHPAVVQRASFSPDSRWVVTVSVDGTAQVWDLGTGEPVTTVAPNLFAVRHAQFSPDSRLLATASTNGTARVWDLATGQPVSPPLIHTGLVNHVEFSPDGKLVVTAGSDRSARVWEVRSASLVSELRNREAVNYAWFTPDSKEVVTVNVSVPDFFEVEGWPFRLAEQEAITLSPAVEFHPEPKWTFGLAEREAITAIWGQAQIWDVATGKPVGSPRKLGTSVSQVAISPDGRSVIPTCSAGVLTENEVWVTDLVTGQRLTRPFHHDKGVIYASFSPDGKWAVTASWDQSARVWDATTGQPVGPRLTHEKAVYHASFSPDSRLVATASEDQTARVWDATTGEPVSPALKHHAAVHRAFFSPDGRWLLTTSVDGIARVWKLPRSSQPVEDELARAEFLAAHKIDDTGAVLPASPEAMKSAWLKWQAQTSTEERKAPAPTFGDWRSGAETGDEYQEAARDTHPPLSPGHDYFVKALSTMNKLRSVSSSFSSNEWAQVIEEFSRAIEAEPDAGSLPYYFRGRGYEHLRQYEKAISDFRESLWRGIPGGSRADLARSYLTRGQCYLRLGEIEKGEADIQTALELAPVSTATCNSLAWLYVTGPTNCRSPQKALPLALKAVELGGTNYAELNTLGIVYYRLGQWTNAMTTLETGIKADKEGGSASDFFFLAMSCRRLGDLARAQEYFAKATNWVAAQTNLPPNDKVELDAFRAEADEVLSEPKAK